MTVTWKNGTAIDGDVITINNGVSIDEGTIHNKAIAFDLSVTANVGESCDNGVLGNDGIVFNECRAFNFGIVANNSIVVNGSALADRSFV